MVEKRQGHNGDHDRSWIGGQEGREGRRASADVVECEDDIAGVELCMHVRSLKIAASVVLGAWVDLQPTEQPALIRDRLGKTIHVNAVSSQKGTNGGERDTRLSGHTENIFPGPSAMHARESMRSGVPKEVASYSTSRPTGMVL